MPDYESFREAGFYKSPDLKEDRIFLSDFFEDPDKNPLKTKVKSAEAPGLWRVDAGIAG